VQASRIPTSSRRQAFVVLTAGGLLALIAQLASPVAVPLYDGLQVQDPYRYLTPSAGQPGSPTSYTNTVAIQGGKSPTFVASTKENPPQAQLIALPAAFVVASTATTVTVTIQPVARPAISPVNATIVGNVYRFAVTDQAGAALALSTANPPTMTLRGPDGVTEATIAHLTASGGELLQTGQGGALAIFSSNPSELGDFAVVTTSGSSELGQAIGIALGVLVVVAVAIFLFVRQRRLRAVAAEATRARGRGPTRRTPPGSSRGGRRRGP
jgi:hypothetical protein